MVAAQLYQCGNVILVFLSFILYVVAFSSNGWLEDDYYMYGFWNRCDKNHTEGEVCEKIGLATQKGKLQHFSSFFIQNDFIISSEKLCILIQPTHNYCRTFAFKTQVKML